MNHSHPGRFLKVKIVNNKLCLTSVSLFVLTTLGACGGGGDGGGINRRAAAQQWRWEHDIEGLGHGRAHRDRQRAAMPYVPEIAIDANGNALAVWYQFDGPHNWQLCWQPNIWSNRYIRRHGWGTAALIETHAGGFPRSP